MHNVVYRGHLRQRSTEADAVFVHDKQLKPYASQALSDEQADPLIPYAFRKLNKAAEIVRGFSLALTEMDRL